MSKYVIKEERINEFIGAIFKSFAKKKGKSIAKTFKKDPEMQKLFKRGDELQKDMETLIKKKREADPEYKKSYDELEAFLKQRGLD
jgi:hypothetical protein|tara:strand:- start:2419 stop:2676 length:258 start_codon:yes stop_codon:yes gene_type:complete